MADQNPSYRESPDSKAIGKFVEDSNFQALMRRRTWERRWYNTNWFDDGMHFRVLSRKTGQVIDHVERFSGFIERALPRASKQIRGIGSLLMTPDYYPTVFPERIVKEEFIDKITKQIDQQAYTAAEDKAKRNAKLQGIFLQKLWEDELMLDLQLIDNILLTLKNGISFIQVYTDPRTKRIATDTLDAFDVIMYGDRRELQQLPFITKAVPWDFNDVMASDIFDEDKKKDISPDNQYATSEIKDAYMRARYGSKLNAINVNTVMVRETFMKEYLTDENWKLASKLSEDTGAMEGKSKGDMIMRHPFSVGGVCLKDEYVDYDDYPFAEFRMESGLLYQVPVMERFIPMNKTQDIVVTRIEKWINTMVAGIYRVRKGENFVLSNIPGGMLARYEGTPPDQMNITNVGPTPFQFMEVIDKFIEEQGISSTNISQLPNNIANNTIENIQQQEYTNLRFANIRFKAFIKKIGELCLERGDKDYIKPVEMSYEDMENGKKVVKYFDVIGARGKKAHDKISARLPQDIVLLNRRAKIRIEADTGLGLTADGRRQSMLQLIQEGLAWYKEGFLSGPAMAMLVKRYVEEMGYGSTEEFMEEVDKGVQFGNMTQTQIDQMKIALLQVLKDTKAVGPAHDKALVDSTKLGALQTLKDTGLLDQLGQQGKQNIEVDDLVKLYEKAPPDVRNQILIKLGMQPSNEEPITLDQAKTAAELHKVVKGNHEMKQVEQQQNLDERAQDASEQQFERQQTAQEQQAQQAQQSQNSQG